MAPETVRHVVVLNLTSYDGGWRCGVDRWDPRVPSGELVRVSWNAERSQSAGYVPAAGGAVWVAAPPGHEHSRYEARTRLLSDPLQVCWTEGLSPDVSLMLVAVLPPGFGLARMSRGPEPEEAKRFDERMAVFWVFEAAGRKQVCWTLRHVDSADLDAACSRVNEISPHRVGLLDDQGDVAESVLRSWVAVRKQPTLSAPAEAVAHQDNWEVAP
jgi:hypothetical protein